MKKLLFSLHTICCCFASAQQVNFSRYLETDFSPDKFEKTLKLNINHHEARYYQAKALIQVGHLNDASRELKILANEKYLDSALILQTVQRRIEKNR
jgi:hypothetical protein